MSKLASRLIRAEHIGSHAQSRRKGGEASSNAHRPSIPVGSITYIFALQRLPYSPSHSAVSVAAISAERIAQEKVRIIRELREEVKEKTMREKEKTMQELQVKVKENEETIREMEVENYWETSLEGAIEELELKLESLRSWVRPESRLTPQASKAAQSQMDDRTDSVNSVSDKLQELASLPVDDIQSTLARTGSESSVGLISASQQLAALAMS